CRPFMNSERLRQRESGVYAGLTFSGSRQFQASSARRTFLIAVSRVNGGTGGRAAAFSEVIMITLHIFDLKSDYSLVSSATGKLSSTEDNLNVNWLPSRSVEMRLRVNTLQKLLPSAAGKRTAVSRQVRSPIGRRNSSPANFAASRGTTITAALPSTVRANAIPFAACLPMTCRAK